MESRPGKTLGLEPGGVVHVRSRQYLVEDVVPPPVAGQSTLVRLSCLADDALGERLEVLWEREIDGRVSDPQETWNAVSTRGFDEPRKFSAYLNTLRWNCVTATNPALFQSPYRAGIEVKAFQLEPLRKALLMPRVNLFVADDVGVGKTIEAGLIVREMMLRQRVRRVLVCCPPSVVTQWKEEMEQRFGLMFAIYDREYVASSRQERGYTVNPWTTHSRFIVSQALIRDEAYAAPLRDWMGEFTGGSLLILDEAHNVAPASGSKYAIDSHLTRTIRDLAPRFEHRLFLSATPHNGHSNSFAALLEILDPQRFCRGVPVKDQRLLDTVMVRRLKSDLREISAEDFPKREVEPIVIDRLPEDAPELVLSRLLQRYRESRELRFAGATAKKRATAMLVVTTLQKRLLSSIEAFWRTLEVHRKSVVRAADEAVEIDVEDLPLLQAAPGSDDVRASLDDDEVEAEDDAEMTAASKATGGTTEELHTELALLDEMRHIAGNARHDEDSRVEWIVEWVRKNLCPDLGKRGARWLDGRLLVFTEYGDTKRYLQRQLGAAVADSDQADERIGVFQGGMSEEKRKTIKDAFNMDPAKHPLRILIATDAAREGVNLQNHCADLVHFDVPWNPSRLEQRNGRIDRKLQRAKTVRCRYFILPQRAEDRVLQVLVAKTKTIHEELGCLSPVIERRVDRIFGGGIRHTDEGSLIARLNDLERPAGVSESVPDTAAEELEVVRERKEKLSAQLDVLDRMLKEAYDWIGFNTQHFRDAISASLEIACGTNLRPVDQSAAAQDPDTATYVVPAIHERKGSDPSWATTLDSLRPPRKKGENEAEWRRKPPRPVVFRDPKNLDGAVVHLHLEHRLVQRLLGRFLAQGFVNHDLRRVCVLRTDDPIPRIVVLGRLSLYGERAARLHDEVISVAADWEDPNQRGRRKLRPLDDDRKDEVLRLLDAALASQRLREVSDATRDLLIGGVAQDIKDLASHLDKKALKVGGEAVKLLTTRGDREAVAMRKILEEQRKRIERHAATVEKDWNQLLIDFERDGDGRRQLELDRRHWTVRLNELSGEMESEPARIRDSYVVKARRVEPVGVVYLWPVSR
jgi:ERCC4-related helicase